MKSSEQQTRKNNKNPFSIPIIVIIIIPDIHVPKCRKHFQAAKITGHVCGNYHFLQP